jgi:hypothetical protein
MDLLVFSIFNSEEKGREEKKTEQEQQNQILSEMRSP